MALQYATDDARPAFSISLNARVRGMKKWSLIFALIIGVALVCIEFVVHLAGFVRKIASCFAALALCGWGSGRGRGRREYWRVRMALNDYIHSHSYCISEINSHHLSLCVGSSSQNHIVSSLLYSIPFDATTYVYATPTRNVLFECSSVCTVLYTLCLYLVVFHLFFFIIFLVLWSNDINL